MQFRLQFTQRQVRLLLNELTHPIGKCRPQGRSPPLEQRRGLIKFPTLLLDTPNPRLAHIKVRCNFPSASPLVARCEHLATELFRIRFHRHLLECAYITQPSQMALDLCQMRSSAVSQLDVFHSEVKPKTR